jgi:EmrB/QacA subfamily drug resistance transporter
MTASQRWTLVVAILGSSIVFLDGTIVNIALPRIGEDLPATIVGVLEGQTYVASGYLAVLAALLIPAGALGDRHGRRLAFAIGLAGFGVTSALCGLAPNLELLALARLVQGAAGALLVPGSLAIITVTFQGGARVRAFGVWAAATSATATLGPPIGGILVETLTWRSAFLVNVPLVVLALWLASRYMAESRDEEAAGRIDWLGAFVVAVAIGGLVFGAIRGQERQWTDPIAWASLAVGAVALVAFPVLMRRGPNVLVPPSLFRIRAFAVINLSTLLIYGALYGSFFFQNLFLQGALGYTPLAAAIVGLPTGIFLSLLSTRVGSSAARLGARRFLVVGPVLMALGMLWWVRVPATSAPWLASAGDLASLVPPLDVLVDPLPSIVLFAAGITLVVAPLTATLMASVPAARSGLASAINNAISRVGQPLVSAGIFVAVTGSFYATLAARVPGLDPADPALRAVAQPFQAAAPGAGALVAQAAAGASTDAFHVAAIVFAGLLLAGAAANWFGLREVADAPA